MFAQSVVPPPGPVTPPPNGVAREARGTHPAPHRSRARAHYLLAGLVAAPLAWIVQICTCEALTSQACFPMRQPLSEAALASLLHLISLVSGVCFVISSAGMAAAWVSWRATRRERTVGVGGIAHGLLDSGEGRTRFLALVGVLGSSVFMLGLLLTAMAAFVVSPCAKW
ncbi:hypothetical protein [Caballeronia sp.]|uniref:hypothetical protein n=1 Tax=Caballeronia sp. TaxID=1931223 RepID=UPI003C49252F